MPINLDLTGELSQLTVTLRATADLRDELSAVAADEGCSVDDLIERLVYAYHWGLLKPSRRMLEMAFEQGVPLPVDIMIEGLGL